MESSINAQKNKNIKKLEKLIEEIDKLIENKVTTSSSEFNVWHKKALRFISLLW